MSSSTLVSAYIPAPTLSLSLSPKSDNGFVGTSFSANLSTLPVEDRPLDLASTDSSTNSSVSSAASTSFAARSHSPTHSYPSSSKAELSMIFEGSITADPIMYAIEQGNQNFFHTLFKNGLEVTQTHIDKAINRVAMAKMEREKLETQLEKAKEVETSASQIADIVSRQHALSHMRRNWLSQTAGARDDATPELGRFYTVASTSLPIG